MGATSSQAQYAAVNMLKVAGSPIQQGNQCDQVARHVALALLPLTKKNNRLLEIHKDGNYSWLFDRAELPMVRSAVASSAKYFPFPETIASVLLSVNFSQLTFINVLISARRSGLCIISTGSEKDAGLRVPAC